MLDSLARQLGFIGLLFLLAVSIYLGYRGVTGNFYAVLWWLFAIPFGLGIIAEILYQISWKLAAGKGFEYDAEKREASWLENGRRVTYHYPQKGKTFFPSITHTVNLVSRTSTLISIKLPPSCL